MKRFLITFALSIALVLAMCVTSFAFEIPDEYEGTNYGAHYDTSHDGGCCTITNGETSENHYDEGYYTGYKDGLASTDITDEEKQAIIQAYLESQAFQDAMAQAVEDYKSSEAFKDDMQRHDDYQSAVAQAYTKGVEDGENGYKNSDAHNHDLRAEFQNGVNSGYEAGYNAGYSDASKSLYDKGLADGYVNFREGEEYKVTLQSYYDGGYTEGYSAGFDNSNSSNKNEGADWTKIVTLLISVIVFVILLLFVSKFKKNKKSR